MTNVSATFPYPELTVLADLRPTFLSLRTLHAEIQSNFESVSSIQGNGELSHLSSTISAAKYLIESNGVAFEPPTHPKGAPEHPAGATDPQINEINRQFLADPKEFTLYISVAVNLKRQLIKAAPAIYLAALRHPTNIFSLVSVLTILDHSDTTYGKITSDALAKKKFERASQMVQYAALRGPLGQHQPVSPRGSRY